METTAAALVIALASGFALARVGDGVAQSARRDHCRSCAESSEAIMAYRTAVASDLKSMIEAALADAARSTKLDPSKVKVASAERVTWPDGALGCPKPGMAYTQALVPGYRIRIQAGGELLDYHAGTRGKPFLCPPGRATDPVPDGRI